jgi:hypothetical protein
MVAMMKQQPGLDKRHRDLDGEIRRKNENTLVETLRKIRAGFHEKVPQ